jgi:ribonuclease VapC
MSILDASAIIALLEGEPGHRTVADIVAEGASVGAVNLAEVATRLIRRSGSAEEARSIIDELPLQIFDVTRELAVEAGVMFTVTKRFGLSLGDRLCLALARREKQPAITADRSWAEAGPLLGVTVQLIR